MLRLLFLQPPVQNRGDSVATDTAAIIPPVTTPDSVQPLLENVTADTLSSERTDTVGKHEKKIAKKIFPDTSESANVLRNETPDTQPDSAAVPADTIVINHAVNTDTIVRADTIKTIADPPWLVSSERPQANNGWTVVLFIAIFSILAWLNVSYAKRIRQLFEAIASNRYIRQLMREEFAFTHPTSVFLTLIYLLTGSLILTEANYLLQWNVFSSETAPGADFVIFVKFLVLVSVFYFTKLIAIRLSTALFSAAEEGTEYLFNLLLFNNMLGLVFLPLTLAIVFSTAIPARTILFLAGGIALTAFIFRIIKIIYLGGMLTKISKSYIILYICALEFLPLLVAIKTLQ